MVSSVPVAADRLRRPSDRLHRVAILHTLGPEGTNCHAAAERWFARSPSLSGTVRLHATLNQAVDAVRCDPCAAVMACAAYPKLHEIVFENIAWLDMVDSVIMPTHPMVFAKRQGDAAAPASVATHPAPQALVPDGLERRLSTSNAQAAIDCVEGWADACITTAVAACAHGLVVVRDFGPIGMAFTVHTHRRRALAGET
jgi:prephenate dehydratase